MATLKEPFALDRSLNTTEDTPRNIADVLAEGLSHITGRNASQVDYDNTESGLTSDDVQGAIDELSERPTLPSVDIQTAVDEFSTYNGGILSSLKVSLSPNQDLHGYDSPWVGGANENIADFVDGYSISLEGEVIEYAGRCATVNPITIEPDTTYYVKRFNAVDSGKFIYAVYNGSTVVRRVSNIDNNSALNTSGGDKLYVCAYDGTVDGLKPMVTKNTLPTAYSPYSNICPITGHTQVKVGDDGKNLFENTLTDGTESGITRKVKSDGSIETSGTATANVYVSISDVELEAGTYTASSGSSGSWSTSGIYVRNETDSATINMIETESGLTFTLTAKKIIRLVLYVANGQTVNKTFYPMIRLASDTDPTYKPYNGYQVTVNLGGTYYSGILDVVSGVFVPNTAEVDLGSLTWTKDSSKTFYAFITDSLTGLQDMWCEVLDPYPENYKLNEYNNYPDNIIARNSTQKNVYVKCTTYEDGTASDFKTAMSGYKLVYELATPTPIQLIPTPVKANVGENHLSAPLDGQEITESKYRQLFTWDEVEAYVNAHSGGGSGMNYSTEEQVIGTWIDGKPLYQKSISITGVSIPTNQTVTIYTQANISMKYFSGYLTENNITYVIPEIGVRIQQSGDNIQISSQSGASWTVSEGYVTIRYTKTTD